MAANSRMKLGIIGSGAVALALAKGGLKKGYSVALGNRTLSKIEESAKAIGVEYGSSNEVARTSDIVVLAIKGTAAEAVVRSLATELEDKVVIDACNPIAEGAPVDGILQYFELPGGVSLMEHLQAQVPRARFVKAFNSVGSRYMVDPDLPGGPPSMFICGNDIEAKKHVTQLLTAFGWETFDMGSAKAAYCIEQLCVLWCARGFREGKWNHAFKLLKED